MDARTRLLAMVAELEVLQGTGHRLPRGLWPRLTLLAGRLCDGRALTSVEKAWVRVLLLEFKLQAADGRLSVLRTKIEALEAELGFSNFLSDSRAQAQTDSFSGSHVAVPRRAEQLMYLVMPRRTREAVLGDLAEEYQTIIVPKFGIRYGTRWYWFQVVRSIGPILWANVQRAVKWVWILKGGG